MNGLLIIDDDEGVRRSLERALRGEPYPTYTAASGEEGIRFFMRDGSRVATVISDFRMPGLDGLETLVRIGALNPEITRIVLTGYATMEAAIAATNEGIDGFLTKPFDNRELRAKIREIGVRKRLRQFIPEEVYLELTHSPEALKPTSREVSVLFSDIRGFTAMSQRLEPETVAFFLNNHYFGPMGEIAYGFCGTVDKHIGDGIMVVFGAPVTRQDDALRAVRAGIAMQARAREIDRRLAADNGLRLQTGIGICTGRVFSGVLGSTRKKEFTSVGAAVNMADRLQRRAVGGEILINEGTYRRICGRIAVERVHPFAVKGFDDPVSAWRVCQRPEETTAPGGAAAGRNRTVAAP